MDDDCEPEPDCLEKLLAEYVADEIHFPLRVDPSGARLPQYNGWHGRLLPRQVVERLGIPLAELFWWREDAEYMALRPAKLGITVRSIESARLINRPTRRMRTKPAWKFYYETRNAIYYRVYLHRTWWGAQRLAQHSRRTWP